MSAAKLQAAQLMVDNNPKDAPLGATPMLPAPKDPPSTERAMELFARVLARGSAARKPAGAQSVDTQPAGFGGGRSYDLALALLGASPAQSACADDETAVMTPRAHALYQEAVSLAQPNSSPTELFDDATPLPTRPPMGMATVRPSAPARKGVAAVPQGLLEDAADSVMLVHDPDGATSFDINVSDTLFEELSCRITLKDRRVLATFTVRDINTRRLLEAEAGRLRVQLEERGLTVDEVRVLVASEP